MTDERKYAAIMRHAEDFHGGALRNPGGFPAAFLLLSSRFRRLAPTRDPAGNRALLFEFRPGYGRRPAERPVPGGSARQDHATTASCRGSLDRQEQQRPRAESFWLDQAAPHASMNGVLNGGVRGASWVPPERRPSAKCSAADYQQIQQERPDPACCIRSFLPNAL